MSIDPYIVIETFFGPVMIHMFLLITYNSYMHFFFVVVCVLLHSRLIDSLLIFQSGFSLIEVQVSHKDTSSLNHRDWSY